MYMLCSNKLLIFQMTSIIHEFPIFYKYQRKEVDGDVFNPIKRIKSLRKVNNFENNSHVIFL